MKPSGQKTVSHALQTTDVDERAVSHMSGGAAPHQDNGDDRPARRHPARKWGPSCSSLRGTKREGEVSLGWHFRPSPPRLAPLRHGKMYRRFTRG